MIHGYPYTNFHDLNLDWLIDLAKRTMGIHLETQGDYLKLVNQAGEDISKLKVTYADTALRDVDGNDIESYIINAGLDGNMVVFTNGNGTYKAITIPYATKANTDTNGNALTSYVKSVSTSGNNLVITDGNDNTVSITIPYATVANKAVYDTEGKAIRSYVASIITRDGKLVVADADGHENEITVPYAQLAGSSDSSGDGIDSITVQGNNIVFTTNDGDTFTVTAPYAVKAQSDDQSNIITHAYVAQVLNDSQTGKLTFKAKDGTTIAEITPTVSSAVSDSYGNTIADYIKTIVASAQSNYITITHGNGTVDSLTVNYSTTAYKDTYNNVIGNTYIRRLSCETDPLTGKNVIVAYNGELSELFRFEVVATSASTDENGKAITSYIAEINPITNGFEAVDGEGQTVQTINFPSASTMSLRYRNNGAWEGDNGEFANNPYPFVIELLAGNTVVSTEPMPTLYEDRAPIPTGIDVPANTAILVNVDFYEDTTNWEHCNGRHNSSVYTTVIGIENGDPDLKIDVDHIEPIPQGQGTGDRVVLKVRNLTNSLITMSYAGSVILAHGQGVNI